MPDSVHCFLSLTWHGCVNKVFFQRQTFSDLLAILHLNFSSRKCQATYLLIGTFSIKVPSSQVTLVHVKQIKLSSSLGGADIFAVDCDLSKCVGLTADSCDSNCGFSIPGL